MEIQNLAALEVKKYTDSADFKIFVESLKRRERERIMAEVERELWQEKDTLLADGRKKLVTEYLASISSISQQTTLEVIIPEDQLRKLSAAEQVDAILLHNKLKMEEQQRRNYEARQKEDTNRLKQVMYRRHLEVCAHNTAV